MTTSQNKKTADKREQPKSVQKQPVKYSTPNKPVKRMFDD